MNGREISITLEQPRDWTEITGINTMPETGIPVAIRLVNESIIARRNDVTGEFSYIEQAIPAIWIDGVWEIQGPFPRFDFNPLAPNGLIADGVKVTHWAPMTDIELNDYRNRLKPMGTYTGDMYPILVADINDHERIYKMLSYVCNLVAMVGDQEIYVDGSDMQEAYKIISDIKESLSTTKEGHDEIIKRLYARRTSDMEGN